MEICLGCVLEVLGVGIFFERFTMSFSLLAVDYLSGVQTTDSLRKTSKTSVNRKPNRNHPSWESFCRDKLLEIAALLAGLVAIRHWEDSSHRTIKCQTASPTAMQWYQESLHKPIHQNPTYPNKSPSIKSVSSEIPCSEMPCHPKDVIGRTCPSGRRWGQADSLSIGHRHGYESDCPEAWVFLVYNHHKYGEKCWENGGKKDSCNIKKTAKEMKCRSWSLFGNWNWNCTVFHPEV